MGTLFRDLHITAAVISSGILIATIAFMKTTVVCGLLGSGKTTFIRNYLNSRTEKAAVLVNDFGQAGIDGEILSADGIESIELPSGCVCCTLKFDLITSIQRVVKQLAPDHLLIEPSGVASPSGVLEALESAGVARASVVGIVDAAEFAELYESGMYGRFFREQIGFSDAILVNKVDIAGADAIEAAERLIGEINPLAVLFRTVNAEFRVDLPTVSPVKSLGTRLSRAGQEKHDLAWQGGHYHFETLSFKLANRASLISIERIFHDLAQGKYGTVARAKALVAADQGPYRFDVTFGKVDAVRFAKEVTDSRLVVIGEGLDEAGIGRAVIDP